MAVCQGQELPSKVRCFGALYRCKKCGAVGCLQLRPGACTNQAFAAGKCTVCGSFERAAL